jgi:hypothetical protein
MSLHRWYVVGVWWPVRVYPVNVAALYRDRVAVEEHVETPRDRAARSRVKQGLPPQLKDPATIEKLVTIVEEHRRKLARNGRAKSSS